MGVSVSLRPGHHHRPPEVWRGVAWRVLAWCGVGGGRVVGSGEWRGGGGHQPVPEVGALVTSVVPHRLVALSLASALPGALARAVQTTPRGWQGRMRGTAP